MKTASFYLPKKGSKKVQKRLAIGIWINIRYPAIPRSGTVFFTKTSLTIVSYITFFKKQ